MREGMQIEDANIPASDKLALLHALSETGLGTIKVGSFVSPRYTPQMAEIETIAAGVTLRPGIRFTFSAYSPKYLEAAKRHVPPLEAPTDSAALSFEMCDVFVRRNWNRSQSDELAAWPLIVERAVKAGARSAGIGLGAAWGSNFRGEFTLDQRMDVLEKQHRLWADAGIEVDTVGLSDPMSWCRPQVVEEQLLVIKQRWPEIHRFRLHLHDARGMALVSVYAGMRTLDSSDELRLDGSIGGIGGCPYCGTGRATGQIATEDIVHMWQGMGIETGVDLDKLISCVWMLEEIIGRPTMGHVSKAGPRPDKDHLYDPNAPFVETFEQSKHFKLGRNAYEGGIRPWRDPILGPPNSVP
jgi:hydroxymethylglutaryl-CoA lyase